MAEKKALKGLKSGNLFPVTTNTTTGYVVGTKVALTGLQSLSKTDHVEEYEIPADDDIYDAGNDYKYTDIEVQVAELDPSIEAALAGGTYESTGGVYTAKSTDVAPEYALSYAALMTSGGYRLFKHPVLKLMSVTVDHATKGNTNEIASYRLGFRSFARKIDNVYREQKDVAKDDPITWIDTFDTLPTSPPQGG